MNTVIDVNGLTRRFGQTTAVDSIGFNVNTGEIFGFLGPNGAGKSTTARMLTGVIDPTSGSAAIQGHDIRREPLAAREHLGIVPEEANVYTDLSVWRNVMLMAELHDVSRRRRREEGQRLLELLGLADRKHDKARELSKGLRQRLMLCSALVSEPDILFLDEPTSGLDVHSTRLMRNIIREMNERGISVFLTTHNMAEADEMCHRVAIINKGQIVAIDTPEQLREIMKSSHYVTVSFSRDVISGNDLNELPHVTSVRQDDEGYLLYSENPGAAAVEVMKFAENKSVAISEIATCKPSLEDVFLQLTSEKETGK